jgi:hypothetical protein
MEMSDLKLALFTGGGDISDNFHPILTVAFLLSGCFLLIWADSLRGITKIRGVT